MHLHVDLTLRLGFISVPEEELRWGVLGEFWHWKVEQQ